MATAPTISIGGISNSSSSSHSVKSVELSNTVVTVGSPTQTTIRYYTGPYSQVQTLSSLALELTTASSGRLPTHYIDFGDSIQYNQKFGIRAVASNTELSGEDTAPKNSPLVFLPEAKISQNIVNNGDGTKTTTFTFIFDNGAAEAKVRVGYSTKDGKETSWTSSGWSAWAVSSQETILVGATGEQTLHYSATEPINKETSYRFLLRAEISSTSSAYASGYQDMTRRVFYSGSLQRKFYGSVKYLDDITACTIAPHLNTPASVTAVNASMLASWAKTRSLLTKAINEGEELDYILVTSLPLGATYQCTVSFMLKSGASFPDRIYSDSTINGLKATVLSETGVTITDNIVTTQASRLVPTTSYLYKSKQISKLYGPVQSTGYIVTAATPSVLDINTFNVKFSQVFGPSAFRPDRITKHVWSSQNYTGVYLHNYDSSVQREMFRYTTGDYNGEGVEWGFSSEPVSPSSSNEHVASLTSSTTDVTITKAITKLYGSVNGETKLIYQV